MIRVSAEDIQCSTGCSQQLSIRPIVPVHGTATSHHCSTKTSLCDLSWLRSYVRTITVDILRPTCRKTVTDDEEENLLFRTVQRYRLITEVYSFMCVTSTIRVQENNR